MSLSVVRWRVVVVPGSCWGRVVGGGLTFGPREYTRDTPRLSRVGFPFTSGFYLSGTPAPTSRVWTESPRQEGDPVETYWKCGWKGPTSGVAPVAVVRQSGRLLRLCCQESRRRGALTTSPACIGVTGPQGSTTSPPGRGFPVRLRVQRSRSWVGPTES